jgi:hypothetical protein
MKYTPLRSEVASARYVLDGTLANPTMNRAGAETNAVTNLNILTVVKADPGLNAGNVITMPRYLEVPDPKKPPRMLIFFDIFKGKLDPYRSVPITFDALPRYLMEATKLDPKKPADAIHFFARHLDSPVPEIVRDAHAELSALSSEVIRRHACCLSADSIAARLKNPKTPLWLLDLDCLLLAYCGTERHSSLLQTLIENRRKAEKEPAGLGGALIGYTLLRPKDGLARIREVISESTAPFTVRYEGFRALQFFGKERPDVVPRDQVCDAMGLLLAQSDFADLPIEVLHRLGEDRFMERVLSLYGKKDFDVPIVRRAILRYALSFPGNPKADQFVEERRAEDAELVEVLEEALKLEK